MGNLFIDPVDWPQSRSQTDFANERIHAAAIYFWKWGVFLGVFGGFPIGVMVGYWLLH